MILIEKIKKLAATNHQPSILVIGDLMLDHYMHGKSTRLSPEAPVPVVNLKSESYTLGGAGNVVQNLVALGAGVAVSGATGNDNAAKQLIGILDAEGVNTDSILQFSNCVTTVKTRILVGGHQLARIDKETITNLSSGDEAKFVEMLTHLIHQADVIVLSDYAKGFLSASLTREIISTARQMNKKVIIDPKGNNYLKYSGAFAIKPNRSELTVAAKMEHLDTFGDLQVAANIILEQTDAENLIVTLSEEGMVIFNNHGTSALPVKAKEVYDVTGAGDTVLATIAYYVALGLDLRDACEIANYAAAVVVRQVGSATASVDEIIAEIESELHTSKVSKEY